MPSTKWISIAAVAVAFATAVPAASAATGDDFFVTPGKTVNGISLGETRTAVHLSTPLGLTTPTSSSVTQMPPVGTLLTETYIAGAFGNQLIVGYRVPPSKKHKKGKKKHKKPQPTVVFLSTGAGAWFIHDTGLHYTARPGNSEGSTNAEVAGIYPCSFYQRAPGGGRLYGPDPGDGQICELIYGQADYFYFTFNNGALDSQVPAQLSGFTLSAIQIP
jgi:hypothetical protein